MRHPTLHIATFQIEQRFKIGPEPDDYEVAYPDIEITFRLYPGGPSPTPRGEYGPIDPPDPHEIEFVSAKLINDDGLSLTPAIVTEMAREHLETDDGYSYACEVAYEHEVTSD